MAEPNIPNLRIPLVPSINGMGLYSQLVCNCMHSVVVNPMTGKNTMYLTRRPGFGTEVTAFGTTTKVPHLLLKRPSDGAQPWMAAVDTGGAQVVTDGTTNTTVFTDSTYIPSFVTLANLSGTAKAIVQFRKDGSTAQRVFYASAIGAWTEITDAVFTALVHRGKMEFLDSHMFVLASDRNIYNCKVNDIATWPAGNLIPKSIKLDTPAGLIAHGNTLLAMGSESGEGFVTDGTNNPSGSVLSRNKNLTTNIGLAKMSGYDTFTASSGYGSYYANVGGITFFLGHESSARDSVSLYAFNGSSFEKIANNMFVEEHFSANSGSPVRSVTPFFYLGRRGIALNVTAPSSATQSFWVYDIDWKQWYYFQSTEFMPVSDGEYFAGSTGNRDELMTATSFSPPFGDGFENAYLFDAYVQFEIPNETSELQRMAWYQILGKTSQDPSSVQVSFLDNDAFYDGISSPPAFVSRGNINMASKLKRKYRGGAFTRRMVQLKHSMDVEWKVQEFQARLAE